jgi:hypothetical protein
MRHKSARGTLLLAVLAGALLLAPARPAQGGTGFTVSLPAPPKKHVAGLTLVFECTWANSYAYLPVRVTVNCDPPSPVDRQLTLEVTNQFFGQRRPMIATDAIELPAGTTHASKVIPFPRWSMNDDLSLNVWEGGVFLEDLSFERRSFVTGGYYAAPATLFVTTAQPDVSAFGFVPTIAQPTGGAVPATRQPMTNSIAQIESFTSLAPSELFDDWINYCGLDMIFIAQSDLDALAGARPKARQALRDWTLAGGNLCVFGVGADWHGLAALDEWLNVAGDPDAAAQPLRGWSEPDTDIYMMALQQPDSATVIVTEDAADDGRARRRRGKAPPKATFVTRTAGLGLVAALSDADPFPGDPAEWRWLYNTIGPGRWHWNARHGLSPSDGNPSFDGFMIDDVGLPPVRTYRVLITLFVVGIGPLNYWILRRKGRLHLLLFTVPAAAILVSLALVAYAVVADGFDTYLRARSYTQLDQRRDQAISWARLSYYSGLAPAGGMRFGADTAMLPIDRDSFYDRNVHPLRHTNWTAQQHLQRGWLPSRTPVQYLTIRPYECRRELRVVEADGGCAVENRLETPVRQLLLRSASGDLYYGRGIAPGGRAPLEALTAEADIQRATLEMLGERNQDSNSPAYAGSTPVARMFFGSGVRSRRYRGGYYPQQTSLMEAGLTGAFEAIGAQLPEPRSYVAIVDRPPDVTIGVDSAVERQSLHVIYGIW